MSVIEKQLPVAKSTTFEPDKPPKLYEDGPDWEYGGEITRHDPVPVKNGHCWTLYGDVYPPIDLMVWDDGTAEADIDLYEEHDTVEEALRWCRFRVCRRRDNLCSATDTVAVSREKIRELMEAETAMEVRHIFQEVLTEFEEKEKLG